MMNRAVNDNALFQALTQGEASGAGNLSSTGISHFICSWQSSMTWGRHVSVDCIRERLKNRGPAHCAGLKREKEKRQQGILAEGSVQKA